MKVYIDKGLCIGCALCESSCPDVFEMQENIAVVKSETVQEKDIANVKHVIEDCPTQAIKAG